MAKVTQNGLGPILQHAANYKIFDSNFLSVSLSSFMLFGFIVRIYSIFPRENLKTKKEKIKLVIFKACVCYFLSKLYFSPNDSPVKTMKNIFHFI